MIPGLPDWWTETAARDLAAFQPKLAEYGSHDLYVLGLALNPELGRPTALELGTAAYAMGKAARLTEALRLGRSPSLDTWHDLTVYSMMGRRIRETGELR